MLQQIPYINKLFENEQKEEKGNYVANEFLYMLLDSLYIVINFCRGNLENIVTYSWYRASYCITEAYLIKRIFEEISIIHFPTTEYHLVLFLYLCFWL